MPLPLSGRRRTPLRALVGASAVALIATTAGLATASVSSAASVGSHPAASQPGAASPATANAVRMARLHQTSSRAVRAQHALLRAQRALSPTTVGHRPDASLALRKLWLLRDALPKSEQKVADKLSGRPSSNQVDCSSPIACIHWTAGAVSPTWPATVRDVITHVGQAYQAAGYRATLPDGTLGGTPETDIYITDLPPGLYGYCTTDQKHLSAPGHYNVWAFCVLDDDYAEFPAHTPLENLEVTAAHEFFHATQYAYDAADDPWFLEATAVWMEDEMYTDINDNLQYLRDSPITRPSHPIDLFEPNGVFHYGVWTFFRFLTEKYPKTKGGLPVLVLDMWKAADSSKGPRKDLYSLQAINKALRKVGHTTLAKEFALYSEATRRTHSVFSEGAANNYPIKKLAGDKKLGRGKHATFTAKLDHLTSATYRFDPKGGGKHARLKLTFDLGARSTGAEAVVTVYKRHGAKAKLVHLNSAGNAVKKYAFGGKIQAIEVTLVNASTRMANCYQQVTNYSCSGTPVDMNVADKVTGAVTG